MNEIASLGRWRIARLGDVAKTASGGTPKRTVPAYYGGGIPWVKSGELGDTTVYEADETISKAGLDASSAKIFPKGTLCIALYGATVGKLGILGIDAATNQAVCGIFLPELIDTRFAYRFLESKRRELVELGKGGAQSNISQEIIRDLEIPIPPIDEQREIVREIEKQFTRLEAGVAGLRRVQANLKRYRAAVLKAACEGKLVPSEAELARDREKVAAASRRGASEENQSRDGSATQESPGFETGDQLLERILTERRQKWNGKGKYKEPSTLESEGLPVLPDGWTWGTADQLTTVITDGEHITPRRTSAGVLLLSARNVLEGRISVDDVDFVPQDEYDRIAKRLVIHPGDVLLSCSGSVGRSAVVPEGLTFTLVRSVAVLKPVLRMGKYLSITLRSPFLRGQILQKQTQTAQANIFQGKIKTLVIPLPPLAEQQRIVAEVERRLSVVEEIEAVVNANLQRASGLRQSILQQAFTPFYE